MPRPQEVMELQGPQGAHMPVLTARFPLQGALQTLPVTGLEPDAQRSPQTTPPRELVTPANAKAGVKILGFNHPTSLTMALPTYLDLTTLASPSPQTMVFLAV